MKFNFGSRKPIAPDAEAEARKENKRRQIEARAEEMRKKSYVRHAQLNGENDE